jgi:hypothetical protein
MASKGLALSGIVASLALVALTIAIFSASQLRGPEGTVHRFLQAVGKKDIDTINRITFGSQGDKLMTADFVARVFSSGGRYEIIDVTQDPPRALVGVLFRLPDGRELPWIVSMQRVKGRRWLIDARLSATPGPTFMN